jgi:hypothetical protein
MKLWKIIGLHKIESRKKTSPGGLRTSGDVFGLFYED